MFHITEHEKSTKDMFQIRMSQTNASKENQGFFSIALEQEYFPTRTKYIFSPFIYKFHFYL